VNYRPYGALFTLLAAPPSAHQVIAVGNWLPAHADLDDNQLPTRAPGSPQAG